MLSFQAYTILSVSIPYPIHPCKLILSFPSAHIHAASLNLHPDRQMPSVVSQEKQNSSYRKRKRTLVLYIVLRTLYQKKIQLSRGAEWISSL